MNRSKICFWLAAVVLLAVASTSHGAIIVTTEALGPGQPAVPTFTTIPNPSSTDLANGLPLSSYSVQSGTFVGGAATVLGDGVMQTGDDSGGESYFANPGTGTFTIDLGSVITIAQINTYSRYFNFGEGLRAPQEYVLTGSTDNISYSSITTVDNPNADAVTAIYGNSINNNSGNLGTFRYLRFAVTPTTTSFGPFGTFYGEIDVFAVPEPSSLSMLLFGSVGLWLMRLKRTA